MFTAKSIDGIGRFIKLGSKAKVLPLDWNDKSSRVEIGSRKQRFIMTIVIIYMYLEATYQAYRLAAGHMDKSVPLKKYMKLVELFATRLTALMVQTIAFVYYEDVKYFTNQLLNMNTGFVQIYGPNHVRDPCTKILTFWYWFVTIHPAVTAAVYAMDNKDSRYWHGTLLPTGIQPFFVPLFILVEYWLGLFSELGCACMGCIMLAYYKATPAWINELATMVKKKKTKCEQVITLYRALLILSHAFNNAFSLILASGSFALLVDLTIILTCSVQVTATSGLPGLQFPIASLALVLAIECAVRPAANLTIPSNDFLAAFADVASLKRGCGNQRRGHAANMEKERRTSMKIEGHCKAEAQTSTDLSSANAPGSIISPDHMQKISGSRWHDAVARIQSQKRQLSCHFQVRRRREGCERACNEDGIEVIVTNEVGKLKALSPERKRSRMLSATAKSMYPMVVKCFVFFKFEHSTIFNFYSTVLDQTISALLIT